MIVVDTSVWIDHLQHSNPELQQALESGVVAIHAAVIGELALGSIADRQAVLAAVHGLARAVPATDSEVLALIEDHGLVGSGIGWVDAHLLAATLLTAGATLWTHDRRLHAAADRLHISHFRPSATRPV